MIEHSGRLHFNTPQFLRTLEQQGLTLSDVDQWCYDTFGPYFHRHGIELVSSYYAFRNEDQWMLFKLRWL